MAKGPGEQVITEYFDPGSPQLRLDGLSAGGWRVYVDGIDGAQGSLPWQDSAEATILPNQDTTITLARHAPAPALISGSFSGGASAVTKENVVVLYLMSGPDILETQVLASDPDGVLSQQAPQYEANFGGDWRFSIPRVPEDRDYWIVLLISGAGYTEGVFQTTGPIRAGYHDLSGLVLTINQNLEHWVQISFNPNGGDNNSETIYRRPGESFTLPDASQFVRTGGYNLVGWSTDYQALPNDPGNLAPGETLGIGSENQTYFAIWQAN